MLKSIHPLLYYISLTYYIPALPHDISYIISIGSEATCTSQIRTATAVSEELGAARAATGGVGAWARIHQKNSERDVQKVVQKQGTKLDIPLSEFNACGESIPWISPRDWLKFMVEHGLWHRLAGLSDNDRHLSPMVWKQFWDHYKMLNPGFSLFSMENDDFGNMAALFIHGDEGRMLKKSGIMITALQSALGFGFDAKRMKRDRNGLFVLRVNYVGHTYTTRMVTSAIPKHLYESKPEVFYQAMDILSQDLQDLLLVGIFDPVTKQHYKACVIATKGDWPYLAKVAKFTRTFQSGAKKGGTKTSRNGKPAKCGGICHLCLAGQDEFPYEEIATPAPKWLRTEGVSLPWNETPAFIERLCHDQADPATFFQGDPWHGFHLGIGKAFVTSTVHVCLQVVPARTLELKWPWLSEHYKQFCKEKKLQPHITKITPTMMSYNDKTGVKGCWSKGALTANFMRWLPCLIRDLPADKDGVLEKCFDAATKMNYLFGYLFNSPLFLNREESLYIAHLGFSFLERYAELARYCFDVKRGWLFPLFPKLHSLHHIFIKAHLDAKSCGLSMSPLAMACQQDEDCVGRLARVSRRVSPRLTMLRTLQRYLIGAYDVWTKAGLIRNK